MKMNWKNYPCFLEVDLEYPENLHDLHMEYPLAPEKLKLGNVEKLVPNLHNKEKYVVHHEMMKFYEKMSLKILKIHKGIKFEEKDFMKKYIELNINLRKKKKNEFENKFFKKMNNSVFGKTMENLRKRVDIKFTNSEEKAVKYFSNPRFDKRTIFSETFIAVHFIKNTLKLNKPIYLGCSILDLSKLFMFKFHYDYIKKK